MRYIRNVFGFFKDHILSTQIDQIDTEDEHRDPYADDVLFLINSLVYAF